MILIFRYRALELRRFWIVRGCAPSRGTQKLSPFFIWRKGYLARQAPAALCGGIGRPLSISNILISIPMARNRRAGVMERTYDNRNDGVKQKITESVIIFSEADMRLYDAGHDDDLIVFPVGGKGEGALVFRAGGLGH